MFLVLIVFKGVLPGHESPLILSTCCLVGHGRTPGKSHGPAKTVPSLPLGHLGCAQPLSSLGPLLGSSSPAHWPGPSGGQPSRLSRSSRLSLCSPSNYSWLAADGQETHAEGTLL